jgi:hypothetical protein
VGGSVLLFAYWFLHTQPEPAYCMAGWEDERWMHTRNPDRTVTVVLYMASCILHWPMRYRRPSIRHELMSMLLQDHGIDLIGCERSIYTNQKVYDIS